MSPHTPPSTSGGLAVEERIDRADEAEATLAAKEAECECFVEQIAGLRESALYAELQRVMAMHNETLARADALALACAAKDAMLEDCYRQFNFYATEHEKAGKSVKARTNRDFADRIARLIQPAAEAQDHATSGKADHIGDATNMVAPTPGGSDD